ncbi:hypothetical protein BS78_K195800 [Paspalum vaginatum]|uniref:Uncharacterized protein n=1 Tax=Paspalum vaginatum TaxID=158149 RepID=A0A9W7XDJ0_9POAL|nr:hypothetical protein BS78_K195800 [Paspalum vaginatum]
MASATAVLGVLLPKLGELLTDEYNLHKNAKKDIEYVYKELQRIHATLGMVGEVPPENRTELVKLWAADIRELSYDMEDIVDSFLDRVQGTDERPSKKSTRRILKEMMKKITKAWEYSGIGHEIRELKERVKEVAERRDRYKDVDTIVPAKTTSVDPRVTTLYTKLTELVGIDEPKEELIKRVTIEDNTFTQQQRIISIVGFGGLGKTTLAKAVYDELKMQFDCNAFISVTSSYELDKQKYENIHSTLLDERQLTDLAREFLQNKRYFIVIDDIWSTKPWDILRCALVDNDMRSQIIITTRLIDAADHVGGYCYKLKPLLPDSSKMLFCRRIFGCGDILPEQYSEVLEKILNQCGGVPLAIITTSGLLANKMGNVNEWYNICDSIGSGIGSNNYDMENMEKILSLSYYDLPSHLKTCLLYLSIFPEDYLIRKKQLIWRWIGEGFVQHGGGGQSLFEIGESYFNGLINRSLIQLTDSDVPEITSAYEDRSCSMHDMVHDLICALSREENFVNIDLHDNNQNTRPSGSKIRRLSLHGNTWPPRNITKRNMSNVRSLTVFGRCVINSICSIDSDPNLMFIGKLLQLRYLRLPGRLYTHELLVEIEKLQHLQALDLSKANRCRGELPPCILRLRQLMLLHVDVSARLPAGLGNLTSLEELWGMLLDSAQMAEELGRLTQLRVLYVWLEKGREGRWDESLCTAFVASLGKLRKLQTLVVVNYGLPGDLDGLTAECLGNLRCILMTETSVLPGWINAAVLPLLSSLTIGVSLVRREDIQVLGTLQALSYLSVTVQGQEDSPKLVKFVVGADAFPCLVRWRLDGFPMVPSMFPAGAMPRLEHFTFCIDLEAFTTCTGGGDPACVDDDLALGHLPSLRKLELLELIRSHGDEVTTRVKEKLRHEAGVHPNKPSIDFIFGV